MRSVAVSLFLVAIACSAALSQWTRSPATRTLALSNAGDTLVLDAGQVRFSDKSGSPSVIVLNPSATGSADDNRNAIQAAINRLSDNKGRTIGGTVVLNAGVYPLSRQRGKPYAIELRWGVSLCGVSQNAVILRPVDKGDDYARQCEVIRLAPHLRDTAGSGHGSIEKLTIENNRSLGFVTAINLGNFTAHPPMPFSIRNVTILNCSIGLRVATWNADISGCDIRGCGTGIRLRYDYTGPGNTLLRECTNNVTITHCSIWMLTVDDAKNPCGARPHPIHSTDTAILIDGVNNRVIGCNICPGRNGWGIFCANANAHSNYIVGNYFESFGKKCDSGTVVRGIHLLGTGNTVVGNFFDWDPRMEWGDHVAPPAAGNTIMGNTSTGRGAYPANPFRLPDILGAELRVNGPLGIGTVTPNSTLHVNGSIAGKRTAVTDRDYTTSGETIIGVRTAAKPVTITLAQKDAVAGRMLVIKDEGGAAPARNITITGNGKLIDGAASKKLITTAFGALRLYSDGTNWFTF